MIKIIKEDKYELPLIDFSEKYKSFDTYKDAKDFVDTNPDICTGNIYKDEYPDLVSYIVELNGEVKWY